MVFKGCQRCGGDLRVEEDIVTRSEDLVCLQCGNRQVTMALSGPTAQHIDETLRLVPRRPSKYAG